MPLIMFRVEIGFIKMFTLVFTIVFTYNNEDVINFKTVLIRFEAQYTVFVGIRN